MLSKLDDRLLLLSLPLLLLLSLLSFLSLLLLPLFLRSHPFFSPSLLLLQFLANFLLSLLPSFLSHLILPFFSPSLLPCHPFIDPLHQKSAARFLSSACMYRSLTVLFTSSLWFFAPIFSLWVIV